MKKNAENFTGNFAKSETVVRSTAALDESVSKELEIKDPSKERAKAILKGEEYENPTRDDRVAINRDDSKDS